MKSSCACGLSFFCLLTLSQLQYYYQSALLRRSCRRWMIYALPPLPGVDTMQLYLVNPIIIGDDVACTVPLEGTDLKYSLWF